MRLAVDAINLRGDERGMGRYVRGVLQGLARQNDVAVTLLVRDPANANAYRAIVSDLVQVAPLRSARSRHAYERVWYPWNGIRFAAHAPALVTINDDFAFAYPARGGIARWREQAPIRRAIARAARIATISQWSRRSLIERFALRAECVDVLPLAPDPFFFPGSEAPPFDEPFVLAVGAGEARKNVGFLADVFGRAFPEGNIRLVIVGTPSSDDTRKLRAIRSPVSLLTRIDDQRLRRMYRTAAAVAIPSLAEGFGLVAAEAQACGAPVIAADASALPEAVGNAGMLVEPRDEAAWSRALRELVCDPALNARYRVLGIERWAAVSREGTLRAVRAALELAVNDRP